MFGIIAEDDSEDKFPNNLGEWKDLMDIAEMMSVKYEKCNVGIVGKQPDRRRKESAEHPTICRRGATPPLTLPTYIKLYSR